MYARFGICPFAFFVYSFAHCASRHSKKKGFVDVLRWADLKLLGRE